MRRLSNHTTTVVFGDRRFTCAAATTHASSSHKYGRTSAPCHFSIVTIGKRAIVSSSRSVKPPRGPPGSDEWKKIGTVAHDQTGPRQVGQREGGAACAGAA